MATFNELAIDTDHDVFELCPTEKNRLHKFEIEYFVLRVLFLKKSFNANLLESGSR